MMKPFTIQNFILTVTIFICIGTGVVFLNNTERLEWFSIHILFWISIAIMGFYLISMVAIGQLFHYKKKKKISQSIFRASKFSFFILLVFTTFLFFKLQQDFVEWSSKNKERRIQYRKLEQYQYQKKRDSLDRIIEYQPNNFEAFVERGLMKRQSGEFEASIFDYKKALEINPKDFKANLEMGYSQGILGKTTERDSFYKMAVQISPDSYFAKNNPQYLD